VTGAVPPNQETRVVVSETYNITIRYESGRRPVTLEGPRELVDLLRRRADEAARESEVIGLDGRPVEVDFTEVDRIDAERI
jgi:hypothetical protein